jgi:DUF1009 family protein
MATKKPILGMIAGNGILPVLVARGAKAAGYRVCCVGLRYQYDSALPSECDSFSIAGMARVGRWIRLLKKWGATDAIMVGGVGKTAMHKKFGVVRLTPDFTTLLLWYRRLRHDRRDATVLSAIADELQKSGVTLIDSTTLLTQSAQLHIGQCMAVREGDIIAIEAIEGTAALIERAGSLCKKSGWTLIKTAADDHDMRADVPSIGTKTIEQVAKAGCTCIAVGSGRVILLDSPAVIDTANKAGVALVGISE